MNTQNLLELYQQSVMNFHAQMKAPATDCALAALFDANKKAIIKEDAYDPNDPEVRSFHKTFRQELLSCGQTQSAIWFLLQDAPIFRMVVKAKAVVYPEEGQTREDVKRSDD